MTDLPATTAAAPPAFSEGRAERYLEAALFQTRWCLVPAYLVLLACIIVLIWKTMEEFYELVTSLHTFYQTRAISQILIIVDLVLVINLIYMVMIIGYHNFVSKLKGDDFKDRPEWLTSLDYAGLKVQVLGSVIAVSTINLLRIVVDVADGGAADATRLTWIAILHALFLLSALTAAVVNLLKRWSH